VQRFPVVVFKWTKEFFQEIRESHITGCHWYRVGCNRGAVAIFLSGFFSGLIASGGDIQAGLIGGFTALAFKGIGDKYGEAAKLFDTVHRTKIVLHGVVGGISSKLQGGNFARGFASAGAAQTAAPAVDQLEFNSEALDDTLGKGARVATAAAIGGTVSELGGGKFANGAVTGAFSRLYNEEAAHRDLENSDIKNLDKAAGAEFQRLSKLSTDQQVDLLNASGLNLNPNALGVDIDADIFILSAQNSLRQLVIRGVRDRLIISNTAVAGDFAALVSQTARVGIIGSVIDAIDIFRLTSSAPDVQFLYNCTEAGGCAVSGVGPAR